MCLCVSAYVFVCVIQHTWISRRVETMTAAAVIFLVHVIRYVRVARSIANLYSNIQRCQVCVCVFGLFFFSVSTQMNWKMEKWMNMNENIVFRRWMISFNFFFIKCIISPDEIKYWFILVASNYRITSNWEIMKGRDGEQRPCIDEWSDRCAQTAEWSFQLCQMRWICVVYVAITPKNDAQRLIETEKLKKRNDEKSQESKWNVVWSILL